MRIVQPHDFCSLKREKKKISKISATPSVEIARLKLRECSIKYHSDATEDNRCSRRQTEARRCLSSSPRATAEGAGPGTGRGKLAGQTCKKLDHDQQDYG